MAEQNNQATILVVEDLRIPREILASYLEDEGYFTLQAEDGPAAMDIVNGRNVDLVLLDVNMPGMNGHEVLKKIKFESSCRHVPVVMISGLDEIDIVARCIETGAEDYLHKPVNQTILMARIKASLDKKRFRDQEHEYVRQIQEEKQRFLFEKRRAENLLNVVIPIGVALSRQPNVQSLAERVVHDARSLCNADGGAFYHRIDDDCLEALAFEVDSLELSASGRRKVGSTLSALHMYNGNKPNMDSVVAYAAATGVVLNVPDVDANTKFEYIVIRDFDRRYDYKTRSTLTIPIENGDGQTIGVLHLFNNVDSGTGGIVAFDNNVQRVIEALSSLAGVALEGLRHRDVWQCELKIARNPDRTPTR